MGAITIIPFADTDMRDSIHCYQGIPPEFETFDLGMTISEMKDTDMGSVAYIIFFTILNLLCLFLAMKALPYVKLAKSKLQERIVKYSTIMLQIYQLLAFLQTQGSNIYPRRVPLETQRSNYSLSGQRNPVSVSSDHFEEHPVVSDIEHCSGVNSGFQRYKMNSKPRGYILIISNKIFNREEIRHGTVNDCNRLEDLFEKYLDFVVDVHHNKTAKEMEELIENLSSLELLHNMDSLVVVLLSHGFGDSILGTDGNTKNILDLVKLLNGDNCPAMKGKPKMFIVNACRGNVNFGHRSLLDGIVSDANEVKSPFLDQLPSDSDFVIAYSTFPGALSFRDTEKGSYFIQCLVYIFRQSAHKEHVLDLLTEVNNIMAEKITSEFNIKQIAAPTTTLRKKWYLNPPKPLTSL